MQGSHGKVDWQGSAVRLHSETIRLRTAKMQGTLKRMPEATCPWNATWSIWCNCDCSFSTLRGLESGDGSREKSALQKNVEFPADQNHEKHLNKKENCHEKRLFLASLQVSCPETQPWISQATALQCKLRCLVVALTL